MAQPAPRRPQGIYAVVNIEQNIKKEQAANPSITPAGLKAYFVNLYQDLLGNPAVSGLALWVNWEALNPNPPATANPYDWTYLADAFNQASDNANTPAQGQFGGLLPNAMWLKLLAFHYPGRPAYQRSDQAFIDEWEAASICTGRSSAA